MQQVIQTIQREDGSQVRIVATPMTGAGLHISVDVYVLHRQREEDPWKLASDKPHPDWRTMSVSDYIKHGRSEVLQLVSPGQLLKAAQMARRPHSLTETQ